jgi:hypothetical protein
VSSWFSRLLTWKRKAARRNASALLTRSRLIVDKPGRFDDPNALHYEVARIAYLTEGRLRFDEIDCGICIHRVSGRVRTSNGTVPFIIKWLHVQDLLRALNSLLDQSDSEERFARFVEGTTSGVIFAASWEVRGLRREGVLFPALDMN